MLCRKPPLVLVRPRQRTPTMNTTEQEETSTPPRNDNETQIFSNDKRHETRRQRSPAPSADNAADSKYILCSCNGPPTTALDSQLKHLCKNVLLIASTDTTVQEITRPASGNRARRRPRNRRPRDRRPTNRRSTSCAFGRKLLFVTGILLRK